MPPPVSILVAGGTGRQGGSVVAALLTDKTSPVLPKNIYVLTRNLGGATALKLAAQGINLVQGELGKPDSIFEHLKTQGVQLNQTAVFLAQAHGPTEMDDARRLIDAAVSHRIQYLVYSSVDRGGKELSDRDASYCKTFADKFHIEKHLASASAAAAAAVKDEDKSGETKSGTGIPMDYTILRPVWFADNAQWGFAGRLCMTGWRENMQGKRMQIVTTKDIGRWAVEALLRPDSTGLRNTAISIASDELTFQEIDDIFRKETGSPVGVTYGWLARWMIWAVTDLRTMFAWIHERQYGADLQELARTVEPTTFRQWVRESVRS